MSNRFLVSDQKGSGQSVPPPLRYGDVPQPTSRGRKTTQVLLALFCLTLPGLLLPLASASREGKGGLWIRAGLPKSLVKKVLITSQPPSLRYGDASQPPAVQYALVVDKGVYRSVDNGSNWGAINTDLPLDGLGRVRLETLAVTGGSANVLYAGRRGIPAEDRELDAGLYWTDSGGANWMASGQTMAGKEVHVIAVGEQDALTVLCVATPGELYRSLDGGRTWSRLDWRGIETRVLSLAIRPGSPDVIYVGTLRSGIYATENAGVSWTALSQGLEHLDVHDIAIAPTRPQVMYLGTDGGVYKSTNAGLTWVRLGGPSEGRLVHTIVVHPSSEDLLCVGLQYGAACCSTDGGVQWQVLKEGLGDLTVLSLALDPRNESVLWAGTTDGIWRYEFGASSPWIESPALVRPTSTGRPTNTARPVDTATPVDTAAPQAAQTVTTSSPTAAPTFTPLPPPSATSTATLTVAPTATSAPLPSNTPTRVPPPTVTATTVPEAPLPPVPTNTPVVR